MTLHEFDTLLKNDLELQKRFIDAKNAVPADQMHDKAAVLSKIINDLGYDVPKSEIMLQAIGIKPLDDEEQEAILGGWNTWVESKTAEREAGNCMYDYEDSDCWFGDFCEGFIIKYDF